MCPVALRIQPVSSGTGCPQAAQRGGGGVMASLSADFFGDGQAMWYTMPSWNFTDDPGMMGWPQAGQIGSLGAGPAVIRATPSFCADM
jgi:hypothetical protein